MPDSFEDKDEAEGLLRWYFASKRAEHDTLPDVDSAQVIINYIKQQQPASVPEDIRKLLANADVINANLPNVVFSAVGLNAEDLASNEARVAGIESGVRKYIAAIVEIDKPAEDLS